MKIRIALGTLLAVCAVGALTGCGSKEVNLNDYLKVSYSGYDTIGTASYSIDIDRLIEENPDAFGLAENPSDVDIAKVEIDIYDSIKGSLDKTNNLSNGDKIMFNWKITGKESIEEKFPISISCEDKEYTVENLDEAKEVDPFETVSVTFEGIAPNGTARVNSNNSTFSYSLDKSSGLSNDDVVKVSIGDDTSRYISQGMIVNETEREFTVEGLSAYAMKIDDIPQDIQDKMKSQTEDMIKADCSGWYEGNSLKSVDFIGYYFLAPKDSFSTYTHNQIYCVYKITASLKGYEVGTKPEKDQEEEEFEDTYYTYCTFTDIVILPDGTGSVNLSNGSLSNNSAKSKYGYKSWGDVYAFSFHGYSDLDTMFNDCVTSKISEYNYETTVSE